MRDEHTNAKTIIQPGDIMKVQFVNNSSLLVSFRRKATRLMGPDDDKWLIGGLSDKKRAGYDIAKLISEIFDLSYNILKETDNSILFQFRRLES